MSQPNVLFFMTDEHHAQCLSFLGHPTVRTPNLDRLAGRGVCFRHMYTCSEGICMPSRTSFHTGTYLRTHGEYDNFGDLRHPLATLPGLLGDHGYSTFQCGKCDLPDQVARDYDTLHTIKDGYEPALHAAGLNQHPREVLDNPAKIHKEFLSYRSPLPEQWTDDAWTAQRAIHYLQSSQAKQNPWFLWCTFPSAEQPFAPAERFDRMYDPADIPIDWDQYQRFEDSKLQNRPMLEDFWKVGAVRHDPGVFQQAVARYYAIISQVDEQIGRVLDALEAQGLADNTIVVFTADHGGWAGHYGQLGSTAPAYDPLIRIPLIYHDPQRPYDGGREIQGMYQSIDLMPTLLDRIGINVPPTCQGISFLPALDGWPGSNRGYIFSETAMVKTIRSKQWKLNFWALHPDRGELFAMSPQPDEITNYWDDPRFAHVRTRMMQQLMRWMVQCEQPNAMNTRNEAYHDSRWYRWLQDRPQQCAVPNNAHADRASERMAL